MLRYPPVPLHLRRTLHTVRDPLFRHPIARWCACAALLFLGASWIAILAIPILPESDAMIVHYSTTFGIDALGTWRELLQLPIIGAAVFGVNVGLARFLVDDRIARARGRGDGPEPEPRVAATLAPATALLMVATVFVEFATAVGSVLLWRVNTGA